MGLLPDSQNWVVAHAPGMPGTFSPPTRVSDPNMHHGTCATHVPWCMPGSLISGFLWSQWRGKRSRHSRRMHSPQFYVSGKRPIQPFICFLAFITMLTGYWHYVIARWTCHISNPLALPRQSSIIALYHTSPHCDRYGSHLNILTQARITHSLTKRILKKL